MGLMNLEEVFVVSKRKENLLNEVIDEVIIYWIILYKRYNFEQDN